MHLDNINYVHNIMCTYISMKYDCVEIIFYFLHVYSYLET
jgi:hypothetical protein